MVHVGWSTITTWDEPLCTHSMHYSSASVTLNALKLPLKCNHSPVCLVTPSAWLDLFACAFLCCEVCLFASYSQSRHTGVCAKHLMYPIPPFDFTGFYLPAVYEVPCFSRGALQTLRGVSWPRQWFWSQGGTNKFEKVGLFTVRVVSINCFLLLSFSGLQLMRGMLG